jgi:hypothetical protein
MFNTLLWRRYAVYWQKFAFRRMFPLFEKFLVLMLDVFFCAF